MNTAQEWMKVVSIDLVRASYRASSFPQDWDDTKRRREAERYAKLLLVAVENRSHPIAPTRDIDQMWHLHMLHPKAYYEDCMRLFGEIFDHDGGFGAAPSEEPILRENFLKTKALYEQRWGEPYVEAGKGGTNCWHNCQNRCWHACKSQ